jgi:AraC-like DNA-binding protein
LPIYRKMRTKKVIFENIRVKKNTSLLISHHLFPNLCESNSWHYHDEFELVYIPAGKGRLSIGSSKYNYSEGAVVILNANIPHLSFDQGFEGENYEEYVFQIKPLLLESLLQIFPELSKILLLFEASKRGIVLPLPKNDLIFKPIVKNIHLLRPEIRILKFIELLTKLSLSNYQVLDVSPIPKMQIIDAERMDLIIQVISTKYYEDISTKQMAELLHLTESSFCRFFQKHSQKPFKQYLNEYRIMKSCKLLKNTSESVENIAYQCGFNSQSFFNKTFKKELGVSPLYYRKNS